MRTTLKLATSMSNTLPSESLATANGPLQDRSPVSNSIATLPEHATAAAHAGLRNA